MGKIFTLTIFFIIGCSVYSQKKNNPLSTDIQLSKTLKESNKDDDIAIIQSIEEISFGYDKKNKNVTVTQKIKQDYINLESRSSIPVFVFYDDQSSIKKIKAKSLKGEFGNLYFKDEYYSNNELFHTDARVKWTNLNFPLQGSKYHFSYEKKYNDIKYFVSSYLDDKYPITKRKITIAIPDWLNIEIKEINFNKLSISKTKDYDEKEKITTYTYSLDNIGSVADKENTPGPTHYRPHLLFLAKSHNKNEEEITLLNNTSDLYNWYRSLVEQINDTPEAFKEKTLSLLKDCKTDEEKIKAIYYWVQDNIRYIAFEDGIAGFKPDEAQNVYKKKYGDCKGMANLTKQMLKIAGFDARLTWIGTKHIAYDYSLPTIAVDNHMICTVINGDKKYYLDSTEKYNSLDYNAERIQNKQVLIENGDEFILDKIPLHKSIENLEIFEGNLKINNEQLIGEVSRKYKGESKSHFLYSINNLKTDRREQVLERYIKGDDKNVLISNIQVTDITDRDGDLSLTYEIDQKNAVSAFDNELYVDIDYYKEYKSLDLEKRKIDYILPYKVFEKTHIDLEIPLGYTIKELPTDLNIKNNDFEISFQYKKEGNKIKYSKSIHFSNAKISKGQIESWRSFHKNVKEQYQKQIILSKG